MEKAVNLSSLSQEAPFVLALWSSYYCQNIGSSFNSLYVLMASKYIISIYLGDFK